MIEFQAGVPDTARYHSVTIWVPVALNCPVQEVADWQSWKLTVKVMAP